MSVSSEILREELGDLFTELQGVRRDLAWMQGQLDRIRVLNESIPSSASAAQTEAGRESFAPALAP
jgi:hypothetical protein